MSIKANSVKFANPPFFLGHPVETANKIWKKGQVQNFLIRGREIKKNKLGLSCAKLSLASAKLHTSLSSDQLKLATNLLFVQLYLLS